MTTLELLQALIERTDKAAMEAAQFEPVPLLAKAQTMAMLYQAMALERIAICLEQIAKGYSFE